LRRLRSKVNAPVFLMGPYVPRTYEGEITLFRSVEINAPVQEHIREWRTIGRPDDYIHTLGWSVVSTRPIRIYDIPGKHEEAVREPIVRTVAARLKRCLEECQVVVGRPEAAVTNE
jgi:hypothetical protein